MANTQEQAFYISSVMAAKKEQAYKAAINHYFNGERWDETILGEYAGVNISPDGTEVFYIGETELIKFGPLESNTVIEDDKVSCLFNQKIEKLY